MDVEINEGFTVYKNHGFDHNLVFITPHSGPAIELVTSRDDNSETVASLAWLNIGGSLVVSNCSRKMSFGIDFNRQMPSEKEAIDHYEIFLNDIDPNRLYNYRKKYACVTKDKKDYIQRKNVYKKFWISVRNLGNFYVLIHRKYPRLKNFPSIMDIASFEGKGIDKKIITSIVAEINEKYSDFFKEIHKIYEDVVMIEEKRSIAKIKETYGDFDLDKMEVEFKDHTKEGLAVIKKYAKKGFSKRLEKNFNEKNFLIAARSALNNAPNPYVTVESVFTGKLSHGPKTELKIGDNNIVMQIELNEFIARFYPEKTAEIVVEIIKKIRRIEKYKKFGFSQTQIKKFFN